MTLRTTAVIAGALGLLMLIAGLISQSVMPDRGVSTAAVVDTPVVVVGPEVLALPGLTRVAVSADGAVEARTARPADAEAWLRAFSVTYVSGYTSWDELSTRTASRIVAEEASPSPSAADAGAEPSPSAEADAAASEEAQAPEIDFGSVDHWRDGWNGVDRVSVAISAVPAGEYLVVHSVDGGPLNAIDFSAERQVNDAWVSPLIWIGAALAVMGVVALVSGLVDVRPAQERIEGWRRRRARMTTDPNPQPGSRRERRLAGSTLPPVVLDDADEGARELVNLDPNAEIHDPLGVDTKEGES